MRCGILLLCIPAALGAQKYQLVASLPGMSGIVALGAIGHPFTIRETTSDVVVTRSDTAGDVRVRLVVTGTKVAEIVVDSSSEAAAALARRPAGMTASVPPPISYEILLRNGKPFSLTATRVRPANAPAGVPDPKPLVVSLDSLHPYLSLLSKLPGLGLLVPNSDSPASPGTSITDRFPSHTAGSPGVGMIGGAGGTPITLPPVDITDTTTITWTRRGDAVEGELKQHIIRKSETSNGETNATGTPKVTFNSKGEIQSASWSVSSSSTSTRPDGSVSNTVSSSSYVITLHN